MVRACITAPIISAIKMEHLDQAVGALETKLSEEEIKRLEEPYVLHPVLDYS
jgi:aryl-alcohol dehydrogenase-like predicted oxidoreductase